MSWCLKYTHYGFIVRVPYWWAMLEIVEEKTKRRKLHMSVISMKKLLEVGVHFGHQTKRWNPKMAPYIFTSRNGIYIID